MDTRKAMAVGGGVTAVATVGVAVAMALTSASELSDSPGAPVAAATVVVPAPTTTALDDPRSPEPSASPQPTAVTVPAPEPGIVSPPASKGTTGSTRSPSASSPKSAEPKSSPTESATSYTPESRWDAWQTGRELVAEAMRTGSWTKVREWALAQGWSEKDVDAWIDAFKARHAQRPLAPAEKAGTPPGPEAPSSGAGSQREQSSHSPIRHD